MTEAAQNDKTEIELPAELTTTSSKIRYLLSQNMTRAQVAKYLNIRYQHVRNVQITPIKKQK